MGDCQLQLGFIHLILHKNWMKIDTHICINIYLTRCCEVGAVQQNCSLLKEIGNNIQSISCLVHSISIRDKCSQWISNSYCIICSDFFLKWQIKKPYSCSLSNQDILRSFVCYTVKKMWLQYPMLFSGNETYDVGNAAFHTDCMQQFWSKPPGYSYKDCSLKKALWSNKLMKKLLMQMNWKWWNNLLQPSN